MNYAHFIHKLIWMPVKEAFEYADEYKKSIGFKDFSEQQQVLDILEWKAAFSIDQDIVTNIYDYLLFLAVTNVMNPEVEIKSLFSREIPNYYWIEIFNLFTPNLIMQIIKKYVEYLPPLAVMDCVLSLPDDLQEKAIRICHDRINTKNNKYQSFFYAIGDKARGYLCELFPKVEEIDILLKLEDLQESELLTKLESEKERLMKKSADELIEFFLLKLNNRETLLCFIKLYSEKILESSDSMFALLISRYKYLQKQVEIHSDVEYDKEQQYKFSKDLEIFKLLKDRFHKIGFESTLSLFGNEDSNYKADEWIVTIILELIDIAYAPGEFREYVNDKSKKEAMVRFENLCQDKDYTLDDLERLVNKIDANDRPKLICDDYIEAIIACGKLLEKREINDQHPLFIELREKFVHKIISMVHKDGTYNENISLNGIFYRLAKGRISFADITDIKTYKGLIYFVKSGNIPRGVDDITRYLSDLQVAKLNINSISKIEKILIKDYLEKCAQNNSEELENNMLEEFNENQLKDISLIFVSRMLLQLSCYFGLERAKYLLELFFDHIIQDNRMENIFDTLDYREKTISDSGTPVFTDEDKEKLEFLFGKGKLADKNSVMNKMIRDELRDFASYFASFCKEYSNVKKSCNNMLTPTRIVKYFKEGNIPVELKPDEKEFESALREITNGSEATYNFAIKLCKKAGEREYSTIPKVAGSIGDFYYEVLDLKNPMAVAIGYLSHSCFTIYGHTHEDLVYSMTSANGRSFVVYRKGKFLAQSWIWRNGNVICFDSIEAGSAMHDAYKDEFRIVDVYKKAASEIMAISRENEGEQERVKVVTVGKSDYRLKGLKKVETNVPRPLEPDLSVYDSDYQEVLAGEMPINPIYGQVKAIYKDPRKNPITVNDINQTDIDILDNICISINSLRYKINGVESPIDIFCYKRVAIGEGWYILEDLYGNVESGILDNNEESQKEYYHYLEGFSCKSDNIRKLIPSNGVTVFGGVTSGN